MEPSPQEPTQSGITVIQIIAITASSTVRNVWLFLSMILASTGILWAHTFLRNLLRTFLAQMIAQHELPVRFQPSMELLHSVIPWIILLPLIIAFYSAGCRVLALHNNTAPLLSTLKEMVIGIKYATLGTLYALKIIPYFIVPGLAVIILSPIIHEYLTTDIHMIFYYIGIIAIFGWTLHLIIPSILIPVIGVCIRTLPDTAVREGYAAYTPYGWQFFYLCAIEIGCVICLNAISLQFRIPLLAYLSLLLVSLYVLIASCGNLYLYFYRERIFQDKARQ